MAIQAMSSSLQLIAITSAPKEQSGPKCDKVYTLKSSIRMHTQETSYPGFKNTSCQFLELRFLKAQIHIHKFRRPWWRHLILSPAEVKMQTNSRNTNRKSFKTLVNWSTAIYREDPNLQNIFAVSNSPPLKLGKILYPGDGFEFCSSLQDITRLEVLIETTRVTSISKLASPFFFKTFSHIRRIRRQNLRNLHS